MSLKDFFKSEQKTIGKATFVIAIFTVFSRFLGLIRNRLLASTFGPTTELDIYFASFKVPDLIYSIVLAGGVLVSLLPLFSDYYKKNKEKAWELINSVMNIFLIALTILAIFLFIFTKPLVSFLLSSLDPSYIDLAVSLTRILFLAVFFLGLSSIFSTITNYFNRFLIFSLAPILYNLSIILGLVFLSPKIGIFGPAIGVLIGSFLHFFIQFLCSLNYGYKYKPILSINKATKDFFKLLFPRIISSSASQINLLVITIISSSIAVGAITFFNFADEIRLLPVGLIGISFATAVFPHLSKSITEKNTKEFVNNFKKVFQNILYLIIPISILTFLMKDLITSIILKAGAFSSSAVQVTGLCLGVFALSLVFQCLEPTLLRAYFSLKDTKTPAIISLVFLLINLVLSFLFVSILKENIALNTFFLNFFNLKESEHVLLLGLVLAYNISLIIDFQLLYFFLKKKIGSLSLKQNILKLLISSLPMILVAEILIKLFNNNLDHLFINIIEFTLVTLLSFITYFGFTRMLKVETAINIKNLF
ncbi:MAG: murein biosynthesis integral membrane protein MurJ [Candidatus Paceibacterota bacterium]